MARNKRKSNKGENKENIINPNKAHKAQAQKTRTTWMQDANKAQNEQSPPLGEKKIKGKMPTNTNRHNP